MEIIKSNKGKNMIAHNGYIYVKGKRVGQKIYWICKNASCKGTAVTSINYEEERIITSRKSHNHSENHDQLAAIKIRNSIKAASEDTLIGPRQLIANVIENSSRAVVAHVGSADELAQMILYNRNRQNNTSNMLISHFQLTLDMVSTFRNTRLYQYGPDYYGDFPQYDGIVLLFSFDLAYELYNSPIWCIDGTFSVSPSGYAQVYNIGIMRGQHVIPVIYAALANKRQQTYENMLNLINLMLPGLNPEIILCDFEKGAINAFQNAFPNSNLQGCLFHLGQNLIKKINEVGLKVQYSNDENLRLFVRSLIALSFISLLRISDTFTFLRSHDRFPPVLSEIYDYFFIYYIGSELNNALGNILYPVELWNSRSRLFNDVPRTNNAIEGWHNTFRSSFGNLNPTFKNFMLKVKQEDRCSHQKYLMLTNGETIRRKAKYVGLHNDLINFLCERENRDPKTYILDLAGFIYY